MKVEGLLGILKQISIHSPLVTVMVKKVHSSYYLKATQGKFTGCLAPIDYKKDPDDKNQMMMSGKANLQIKKNRKT